MYTRYTVLSPVLSMWIDLFHLYPCYIYGVHLPSEAILKATYHLDQACISELWTTACLNLPEPASKLKVWKTPQAPNFHSFLCWGSGVKNSLIYSWFPPVQDYGGDIFTAFTFHCFCIWMIKQYFIIQMVKNDISK